MSYMYYWRNPVFLKIFAHLCLALMVINPALALQYHQLNSTTDLNGQIPDSPPHAYHIHISQQADVLALLAKRGFDIIPASREDVQHFLAGNNLSNTRPLQLAANPDLEKPPGDECRRKGPGPDCPVECSDTDQTNDRNCPAKCQVPSQSRDKGCTETDPAERGKDTGPVSKTRDSKPAPRSRTTVSITRGFELPKIGGGGGGKGDAAAVMLIVIGVVVIAALFIYAGKWIVDRFSNDEDYYAYWWDIGTQFISLDTGANQHGNFTGLKFSGGFIANRLAHFGLAAEVGRMDLDLLYNRNSTPQRINLEGTYWLLGPTVRWLLGNIDTEQAINNSYFYLELLGGSSDRKEVDMLAVARVGFNTGLGAHLRMGLHYGAFYLGLDEDQGFANDGDNYWNMYGLEIGYQF